MIIGIDFDNTIASYERAFAEVALEQQTHIPKGESARSTLRQLALQKSGGNLDWTLLQGEIYGRRASSATLSGGFLPAARRFIAAGFEIQIISHKTLFPAVGPAFDFHAAARNFAKNQILDKLDPIERDRVTFHFCQTLEEKIAKIAEINCAYFIDDLASVLRDPQFPVIIKRIHFLDTNKSRNEDRAFAFASHDWSLIADFILSDSRPTVEVGRLSKEKLHPIEPDEVFDRLLADAGFGGLAEISLLAQSYNNRVFRLTPKHGEVVCGKLFRRDPSDPRDRFDHETRFLKFAEAAGIQNVPRLLFTDAQAGAALLSFVEGRHCPESELLPLSLWNQCTDFFQKLQAASNIPEAQALPRAAEGAFTLREHLGWTQKRRDSFRQKALSGQLPSQFAEQVLGEFEDDYQNAARKAIAKPQFADRFPSSRAVISPSDFGLHNTLLDGSGTLWFIDFEYAGWDDGLKAQFDFQLQPRYPAQDGFALPIDFEEDPVSHCIRDLLRIKWRYIALKKQLSVGPNP